MSNIGINSKAIRTANALHLETTVYPIQELVKLIYVIRARYTLLMAKFFILEILHFQGARITKNVTAVLALQWPPCQIVAYLADKRLLVLVLNQVDVNPYHFNFTVLMAKKN